MRGTLPSPSRRRSRAEIPFSWNCVHNSGSSISPDVQKTIFVDAWAGGRPREAPTPRAWTLHLETDRRSARRRNCRQLDRRGRDDLHFPASQSLTKCVSRTARPFAADAGGNDPTRRLLPRHWPSPRPCASQHRGSEAASAQGQTHEAFGSRHHQNPTWRRAARAQGSSRNGERVPPRRVVTVPTGNAQG